MRGPGFIARLREKNPTGAKTVSRFFKSHTNSLSDLFFICSGTSRQVWTALSGFDNRASPERRDMTDAHVAQGLFEHEPLQPNEIRLLRFKSIHEVTLDFELEHFPLDDAPTYHALSYTWGPAADNSQIIIGDKALKIRENLASFLGELRYRTWERPWLYQWWWIDAICIDQGILPQRYDRARSQLT